MLDFTNMDVSTLTTGSTSEGVTHLELFLKEYTSIFSEKVNPSCSNCLNNYLSKYKNKMAIENNKTGIVLKAKYQNIPLEFGSRVLVNNSNITPEYAKKLLAQTDGQRFFESLPDGFDAAEKKAAKPAAKKEAAAPKAPAKNPRKKVTITPAVKTVQQEVPQPEAPKQPSVPAAEPKGE